LLIEHLRISTKETLPITSITIVIELSWSPSEDQKSNWVTLLQRKIRFSRRGYELTGEILFVFLLLLVTIVLFASNRLRLDVVAILVIMALMLSGLLSPKEALAGFGDPLVLLIAGLFVIGEGLFRTGVAFAIGNWLMRVGGTSENRMMILLMLVVAGLSAFMSSTGAVAIFIPVTLNLAAKASIKPSRLLIPIAFASLIGGMITLIGTPPNLIVSTQLTREGLEGFGFFDFTPIGLLVLITGIAFMVFWGRKLLPKDTGEAREPVKNRLSLRNLIEAYEISDRFHRLRINEDSSIAGITVAQALLRTRYSITVLGVERQQHGRQMILPARTHTELKVGDILIVEGIAAELGRMLQTERLQHLEIEIEYGRVAAQELGLAEVLLTPRSMLIGQTLSDVRFRQRYGLTVLGVLRSGKPLKGSLVQTKLLFGDALLVGGGWEQIEQLQTERVNFLVLNLPREMDEVAPNRSKAPWALAIIGAMLVLMTFELVSSVCAVLLAALAMVFARCVSMKNVYASINWESLVLIAGMLPMATALEKTGGIQLIVSGLIGSLGELGPVALMAGMFLLTSIFSQFISNTATTVIVAPIAMIAGTNMGLSPYPLLMTVAIAASTAFSTPMASPVNTLVLGPGGYTFNDFVKLGVLMQLLIMVLTLLTVPVLFPLK
jgi:di/tricarboxylate transporter